jgi:hypothetical protein
MIKRGRWSRIGLFFSISITLQGCDPGYWVGVRANLKEPVSPECIEDTLHKLPEIDRVTIYQSEARDSLHLRDVSIRDASPERVPDQFIYEGGDEKGLITQFQKAGEPTTFLAGVDALGMAAEEGEVERIQRFNARIAIQVAQACNARFMDDNRFLCFPDRAACRQAVQNEK